VFITLAVNNGSLLVYTIETNKTTISEERKRKEKKRKRE
jgi:hypothetical protein